MDFKKETIMPSDFSYAQDVIAKLNDYFQSIVVGQDQLRNSLITALLADGHILIESVPGLAKTTAAKAIADAAGGKFSRIQCTPDLLPADIIGTQVYNRQTGGFDTVFGPVFANFVLLDEINRSSAKTQSAMLEAMQEQQVTIGGTSYPMPEDVFLVIATQNPIEQEGTYPLSEAQTDRFMLKEIITYPETKEDITPAPTPGGETVNAPVIKSVKQTSKKLVIRIGNLPKKGKCVLKLYKKNKLLYKVQVTKQKVVIKKKKLSKKGRLKLVLTNKAGKKKSIAIIHCR